ncbi:MAG TPA: glutaminyl-peptide cyclotransferase [Pyrinomonadaceae bacterium]|jgi:glutamine cyclotransferase|nr:glutaminyl-peptide cyclotransferase [Pyrinomonadaceae bacterium]
MKNLLPAKASLALACLLFGCGSGDGSSAARRAAAGAGDNQQPAAPHRPAEKPAAYAYEIKNVYPHDRAAFTQGLIYKDGVLWEGTGQYGTSSLRKVDLKTGKVLKMISVPREFFAEGITVFRDKVYQLTWQNNKGFIYTPDDFAKTGEFKYAGEGWGLTHDADSLIMSDGTSQIRFIDPETFAVRRTISVSEGGHPLAELNELEYVKGEIYANVWQTDRIVRIDPKTGNLTGTIDLAGLLPEADRDADTDVLNGIAYDEAGDRLFVTGKLWPKLFEIRLIKK